MPLFSGMSNLFSGIASLFGGQRSPSTSQLSTPTIFDGQPASDVPPNLFAGATLTSRPRGDEIFTGEAKPIPPAAVTDDGIGHVYTFTSLWNSATKTYNWRWDEAYRRSWQDALAMRRDCYLQGLLKERQYPTAQMSWHLEPDDKSNKEQAETADYLTACIKAIPSLTDLLMAMLDAIWYGRSGVQLRWDWEDVRGQRSFIPREHWPVNGDKIQFSWDGIPQIMIYAGETSKLRDAGLNVFSTDRWMVAQLDQAEWRDKFLIHKHDCIDADFFESEMHGGIHGVGVRHWIYWMDWNRKEIGSYLFDFLERVGSGFNIYYYEPGDATAEERAIQYAKTQGRNTWIVWPRRAGDTGAQKGVERIEPGTGNADILRGLMEYFDEKIERFIVGQTMSGGSDNDSGLGGSGRAKFAQATKAYIIKSDCERLAGTLTRELVAVMQKYNRPAAKFPIRWVFDIDAADPKAKLDAVKSAWEIGVSFDEDEVRALTGMKKPAADAVVIRNPQIAGAGAAPGMPGTPPAGQQAPPMFEGNGDGASLFGGQPAQPSANGGQMPLFEGKPAPHQDSKEGPPMRYAEPTPPIREEKPLHLVAYRGDHQQPFSTPLGSESDVSMLYAWMRTQDAFPELQQFAIDSSTNPAGNAEDVFTFAGQLEDALAGLTDEGAASKLKAMGAKLIDAAMSGPVEGLVVTAEGSAPEGEAIPRYAMTTVPRRYAAAREVPAPAVVQPPAPQFHVHLPESLRMDVPPPVVDSTAIADAVRSAITGAQAETAELADAIRDMGQAILDKPNAPIHVAASPPAITVAPADVKINAPPAQVTVVQQPAPVVPLPPPAKKYAAKGFEVVRDEQGDITGLKPKE